MNDPMARMPSRFRGTETGASLLEVLISVLILSIGILGIAALQSVSLRNTASAEARSAAVVQSYAMFDMMRANRPAALAGNYDQGFMCEPPNLGAGRVAEDLDRWIMQLQESLGPSACGRIECGVVECEIGVRWDDSRATAGDDRQEIITVSRL